MNKNNILIILIILILIIIILNYSKIFLFYAKNVRPEFYNFIFFPELYPLLLYKNIIKEELYNDPLGISTCYEMRDKDQKVNIDEVVKQNIKPTDLNKFMILHIDNEPLQHFFGDELVLKLCYECEKVCKKTYIYK